MALLLQMVWAGFITIIHHQEERFFIKVALIFYNNHYIVCEVDSSKMRESSAGPVDGELDENFYVLTLSSKAPNVDG
jgi:hypothetical protein